MKNILSILCVLLPVSVLPPRLFAQGGMPLCTNYFACNSYQGGANIATDVRGNVFVTEPHYFPGTLTSSDYATIAYSSAGVALWTNRYDGPGNGLDISSAIAADASGNVFVTGGSTGSDGNMDYATIKYSGAGVALWTNLYHGPANSSGSATAIAVDSSGNVLVTGDSGATLKYSGAGVALWTNLYNGPANSGDSASAIAVDSGGNVFVTGRSATNSTSFDYATIAYSGAGVPLWTNLYNGPDDNDDEPTAIAVDRSGNVFVTGIAFVGSSSWDFATIAYSGAGVPLWTNRYNGPANGSNEASALAMAVDSNGNVFVTGDASGTPGSRDYATVKYSGAGVALWTNLYTGPARDANAAYAIAVDGSGNVIVTGQSGNGVGGSDYATIAYSGAGAPLWTNRYHGPGLASAGVTASGVVVDNKGNVIVTGNLTTIKYSAIVPAPPRLNFQRLNNQLVLSWTDAGFTLQSAPAVTGTFTNIPSATSPYTIPLTAPQQFFRLSPQ